MMVNGVNIGALRKVSIFACFHRHDRLGKKTLFPYGNKFSFLVFTNNLNVVNGITQETKNPLRRMSEHINFT